MGKFEADLFVMTNATKFIQNSQYQMAITERCPLDSEGHIELSKVPINGTISIPYPVTQRTPNGRMEETPSGTTLVPGAFTKTTIQVSGATQLAFYVDPTTGECEMPNTVTVSYYYLEEPVQEARIDNRSSAMGEAILQWPVYGNGDDCTDASIIGYVTVKVLKCRVTSQPGFDSSYKTNGTFQFTLAVMDAKQPDEAAYTIAYKRIA